VSYGVYIAAGDGPNEGLFQWFDGTLVGNIAKWSRRKLLSFVYFFENEI